MKLGVKLLHHKAVMPGFQTEGAACFDLVAVNRGSHGGNTTTYGTGLAFDVPDGYHLKVYSRSGHGFNNDVSLVNSVGIIDADYTGEVKVKLAYSGTGRPDWPYVGDRIAQAMLVKNVKTDLIEVTEIKETERGAGGLGSTGS